MGSKQFANALRMQHILRYDMMELQYLNHLSSFALNGWLGQKFAAFPRFDVGIGTGNPGVFQRYPYPYPRQPVPGVNVNIVSPGFHRINI